MPSNVCKHCGCTEIDEDATRGDKVCTSCGSVLEEQLIVSEIQFQENAAGGASVMGQFVPVEGNNKSFSIGGNFAHGLGRDSRAVTLQNAKRRIQEVADQLRISEYCQEMAHNYFKLVLNKNLTRGRKSAHVIASCLYIVCRKEGLPHMLLDFSDVLQVNVYILGKTYLHLSKELCLQIPVIDPCLYIDRFAHRLQFEEKIHAVCATAMRLVQRMQRDWMHTGRRPSGLCGAALLVAARIHDFSRTVKEVVKVVKVCESTVRKRLTEFEDTPSSQLTIEEFHNIDLEEEQDPPCFTEGKKRSKLAHLEEHDPQLNSHIAEVQSVMQEIEKSLVPKKPVGIWAAYAKEGSPNPSSNEVAAVASFIEDETLKEVMSDSERASLNLPSVQVTGPDVTDGASEKNREEQELMDQGLRVPSLAPTAASLGIKDVVEDCIAVSEQGEDGEVGGELDLEGIDDEELDKLLLSEAEVKLKTEIWMRDNEDYLAAQKEKEEKRLKEEQEQGLKPEKKKKKYKKREKHVTEAASAKEALAMVIQEKKLSRKINYDVLEDLKFKDKQTTSWNPFKSKAAESGSTTNTSLPASQSILKSESRLKIPNLLSPSKEEPPSKKRRVQIREPAEREAHMQEAAAEPAVVVEETGPVQYEDRDPDVAVEEEGEDEEDAPLSAHQLFGREVSIDEEEAYYNDYD